MDNLAGRLRQYKIELGGTGAEFAVHPPICDEAAAEIDYLQRERREIISLLRNIANRIGPARRSEEVRWEIETLVNKLEFRGKL